MAVDPNRFKRTIVDNLFRRAGSLCSNPECLAMTSGPADDASRAVNVGEAAHIYGARPDSARYDSGMTAAQRSDITNAIWLCCNCHKIIDSDSNQYPTALLFEWRFEHERHISKQIGKTGERLRRKVAEADLDGFQNSTYLARQIVIDRPEAWEYKLTAELLRSKINPILYRWSALKRGLYSKRISTIAQDQSIDWIVARFEELKKAVSALVEIINVEIKDAWGEPGVAGSVSLILTTCILFEEACQQVLGWEENVRFTMVPLEFRELQSLLLDLGEIIIDQAGTIHIELSKIFAE